jgi:hypothetical protein
VQYLLAEDTEVACQQGEIRSEQKSLPARLVDRGSIAVAADAVQLFDVAIGKRIVGRLGLGDQRKRAQPARNLVAKCRNPGHQERALPPHATIFPSGE